MARALESGTALTPIAWVRRWLASAPTAGGYAEDCPAGLSIPQADRCAAVDCDSVPLTMLAEGEGGCVTCLDHTQHGAAARLSALGVLPGVEVQLVQRFPGFVLRTGYVDIGLDEALARAVRVRPV